MFYDPIVHYTQYTCLYSTHLIKLKGLTYKSETIGYLEC